MMNFGLMWNPRVESKEANQNEWVLNKFDQTHPRSYKIKIRLALIIEIMIR